MEENLFYAEAVPGGFDLTKFKTIELFEQECAYFHGAIVDFSAMEIIAENTNNRIKEITDLYGVMGGVPPYKYRIENNLAQKIKNTEDYYIRLLEANPADSELQLVATMYFYPISDNGDKISFTRHWVEDKSNK